jgi:hypothetical protein
MQNAVLADLVVLLHAAFVLFVLAGGLLLLRWPKVAWLHIPAAVWGVIVELTGWVCPLTPLENWLRARAGAEVYAGDFVARYVVPTLYPEGLTRNSQLLLGAGALLLNATIYALVLRRRARRSTPVGDVGMQRREHDDEKAPRKHRKHLPGDDEVHHRERGVG